jgi:hypothetical protein
MFKVSNLYRLEALNMFDLHCKGSPTSMYHQADSMPIAETSFLDDLIQQLNV